MIDMMKNNIQDMKLMLEKDDNIKIILKNLVCKNDYITNFEFMSFKMRGFKFYKSIYHESINDKVDIFITDKSNIACGSQCYNIINRPYTDVGYVVFMSKQFMKNELIFDFVLGHELAHFDLSDLPKIEYEFRNPFKETYCDIKSLEKIIYKYNHISNNDYEQILEVIKPIRKTESAEIESKIRRTNIKLFFQNKINSEIVYNKIIDLKGGNING